MLPTATKLQVKNAVEWVIRPCFNIALLTQGKYIFSYRNRICSREGDTKIGQIFCILQHSLQMKLSMDYSFHMKISKEFSFHVKISKGIIITHIIIYGLLITHYIIYGVFLPHEII